MSLYTGVHIQVFAVLSPLLAFDPPQDLSYQGADDRHDRTSHGHKQGQQGEVLEDEDAEGAAPLPQASAYRRQPLRPTAQQQQQQQQYESRPSRLRYARTAAAKQN